MKTNEVRLDVRPIVERGEAPISAILAAIDALDPGQALLLVAPFEPLPLYSLLAGQGFDHTTSMRPDGAWEVRFSRA